MKLIVGLGNPGSEYEGTRHNMGFEVLDVLAEDFKCEFTKNGFSGTYTKFIYKGENIYLLKPLTYMNLSGKSVKEFADYYHIMLNDMVVVSDDMALKPGKIRLREKGSSGGQKGLQDIIEKLGSDQFKRIRVGIGEPELSAVDFVLSKPNKEERELIDEAIDNAVKAIEYYLKADSFNKAASLFNSK